MRILGIETSCDETAICLIETDGAFPDAGIIVRGDALYSQAAMHAAYGGVFPNLAKREHAKNLVPLLAQCLAEADALTAAAQDIPAEKKEKIAAILSREGDLAADLFAFAKRHGRPDIGAIAVTHGPGLEPALWVGVSFAEALAVLWDLPVMPVNHMEGHMLVAMLQASQTSNVKSQKSKVEHTNPNSYRLQAVGYPAIALLVSGGHTELVRMDGPARYEVIGTTRDDAAGEAFDKVARILGLSYPGGPAISKLAAEDRAARPDAPAPYPLPRPMLHSGDLHFSFSGLKTAVLYTVKKIGALSDADRRAIAREFEDAVVEVLLAKTKTAVETSGAQTLILGGGVSANKKLRADAAALARELGAELYIPEAGAATDNALMIALAGAADIAAGKPYATDIRAEGNLTF